jgi:DNA polymerase (family 10)
VTAFGLATSLRQLADFAEIRGTSLEAATWRRLATDIEHGGEEETARLTDLAKDDRLAELSWVPPNLRPKLRDVMLRGPAITIRAAGNTLPWLLRRVLDLTALDSADAASLARQGIVTLSDLLSALLDGRIASYLPASEEALREAAMTLAEDKPSVPLGRALDLIDAVIPTLAAECPEAANFTAAGDARRFEPLVESLVIVASSPDPVATLEKICRLPNLQTVLHQTGRRALFAYQQTELDVRVAAPDEFGTTLHMATGSPLHLAAMRTGPRAARLCTREEDVYSQAGLQWIAPELRHGTGEVEAAANGTLPALVARSDILGDLHMHSTYSDGRDSLALMIQTCASLGYEYIAITDHSEHAAASRTVSPAALAKQRNEIERLRDRFPAMTILHGIEVDIMPDGQLDFPDDILETLDIVLASLHDRAGHDPAGLTRRCLAAIQHPLVNVITHPANRLVGRDPGHQLDFPTVYAAAAANGTALEIDGAPSHLDLDGEHARQAVAAGATVTIDSDCHRARLLDKQMRLGIGTARRGWVEAKDVLNTRPLAEVRAFIAAKRALER